MNDSLASFGVPDWLPVAAQRNLIHEEALRRRDAAVAERELEARRADLHEKNLHAYRQAAEARGEYVSALELATGQVTGRTMADVFRDAREAGDREDARAAVRARKEAQGEVPVLVGEGSIGRSGWPGSEYELNSQLERASDLHRDLVAYRARRNYPEAAEAARAKSSASRSAYPSDEITRACDGDYALGYLASWTGRA
jgi:hypothetical protein